jgi:hypothetical protein
VGGRKDEDAVRAATTAILLNRGVSRAETAVFRDEEFDGNSPYPRFPTSMPQKILERPSTPPSLAPEVIEGQAGCLQSAVPGHTKTKLRSAEARRQGVWGSGRPSDGVVLQVQAGGGGLRVVKWSILTARGPNQHQSQPKGHTARHFLRKTSRPSTASNNRGVYATDPGACSRTGREGHEGR